MERVVIESPLRGQVPAKCPAWLRGFAERVYRERNRHYAFYCTLTVLSAGDAPYASHLMFDQPGLLDDGKPYHRDCGMAAGQAWSAACHRARYGLHLGLSTGTKASRLRFGTPRGAGSWSDPHYKPIALWRCVFAVALRWMLSKVYGDSQVKGW